MAFKFNKFHKDEAVDTDILIGEYAKLAISITHDAFQALYVSSTLIPNQWYLITDYTTYRFIVGDTNTYYRGPVEPIYVQALDVNKVNQKDIQRLSLMKLFITKQLNLSLAKVLTHLPI